MTDRTHPDSGRITNPGAAYAKLPDIDEEGGLIWQAIFDWKDCEPGAPALAAADQLSCLLADQMRAFADATHALRVAPHGQAPAPTHFGDEAHVAIPQMLLGAACSAIDKKRDGTKVLAELRRYTTGDLSQAIAPAPAAQGDALDAARLDWLDKQIKSQDLYAGFIWQADGGYEGNMGLVGKVKTKGKMTARQAIDAARAAQEDKSHDHI